MPSGSACKRPKGGKIRGFERRPVGTDHRQLFMAVGCGAAVAGNVLENRQNAALKQPCRDRGGNVGHLGRICSVGAIADDRIGVR